MTTKRITTPAREDYLKALLRLERGGRRVPTTELARALQVRKPSITGMLRRLRDDGLVDWEPRRGARLSRRGRRETMLVLRRHRLLERFLVEVLDLDWSEVHEEADVLEHHLSDRIVDAIDRRLGHPTEDPHGSPIPAADGTIPDRDLEPLADLEPGDRATVREVHDEGRDRLRRFKELGLIPGARITILDSANLEDVLRLRVGSREVHASPRGLHGIMVERCD